MVSIVKIPFNILALSGAVCYNSLSRIYNSVKATGETFRVLSIFDEIANLNKKGMKFGVAVTRRILDRLGSPDKKLKIIHIAGTNGKGSTAEYISQILIAAGKRVGTFTSPLVESYFDQFKIDGSPIDSKTLSEYFRVAFNAAEGTATEFEVETAGALFSFAEEGCEYAVVECGLGGKLDATNAIAHKEVAVITSIGIEHTAVLGNTYRQICCHKAGIINNCPAVVNALQPEEAREYFKKLGVIFAEKGFKINSIGLDGVKFCYNGNEYKTRMYGREQAYNAACAIEVARLLNIDKNAIHIGISKANPAGRLQVLTAHGNIYVVDGGHNPSGIKPLAELLKTFPKDDVKIIFGCLADKDILLNLHTLKGLAQQITAVQPNSPRATDIKTISAACKKYFAVVGEENSVSAALEKAKGVVAVCGSFTLVKEALNWIEKRL